MTCMKRTNNNNRTFNEKFTQNFLLGHGFFTEIFQKNQMLKVKIWHFLKPF